VLRTGVRKPPDSYGRGAPGRVGEGDAKLVR